MKPWHDRRWMLCCGKELVLLGHISDLCTSQVFLTSIFEVLKAYLSRGKKKAAPIIVVIWLCVRF